jgi:hypothetical protein
MKRPVKVVNKKKRVVKLKKKKTVKFPESRRLLREWARKAIRDDIIDRLEPEKKTHGKYRTKTSRKAGREG